MTKNILHNIFLAIGLLFGATVPTANAEVITYKVKDNGTITVRNDSAADQEQYFDTGALVNIPDKRKHTTESLFPDKSIDLGKSHFTWGAEFGSSIDMTAHNMSTFDLDVNFGYKNAVFKVVGVGVGIFIHHAQGFQDPRRHHLRIGLRHQPDPIAPRQKLYHRLGMQQILRQEPPRADRPRHEGHYIRTTANRN